MKARDGVFEFFRNWVFPILIGVGVTFGIQRWIVSAAEVPTSSMYPTIPNPCYIVVNRLATEVYKPYRGEVVLFHFPDDPSKIFVKRVIGLPGDTVKVTDSAVFINGHAIHESYVTLHNQVGLGIYQVPRGQYFMMGDNRPISDDSRLWIHHFVSRNAIVGKAEFVIFPFAKWHKIK